MYLSGTARIRATAAASSLYSVDTSDSSSSQCSPQLWMHSRKSAALMAQIGSEFGMRLTVTGFARQYYIYICPRQQRITDCPRSARWPLDDDPIGRGFEANHIRHDRHNPSNYQHHYASRSLFWSTRHYCAAAATALVIKLVGAVYTCCNVAHKNVCVAWPQLAREGAMKC
jgi:hypothetical protein